MLQSLKRIVWIGGLTLGLQSSWAFSLLGPSGNGGDNWQIEVIAYNPIITWDLLPIAPKNLGEGYRRNSPVLYYAYDANFLGYFGSNGPVAVDQAFGIMNSLTNVSSYSGDLSEFPLKAQSMNYNAQGLGLLDLKSDTLILLVEQMGLANPVRYIWTLHNRYLPPNGRCPEDEEYLVVQRNYDITATPLNQIQYSSYVNSTLYSYILAEWCDTRFSFFYPAAVLADAVEFPVDAAALANGEVFTPVAAGGGGWLTYNPPTPPYRPILFTSGGLVLGGFFTGLTRDDVAGLRYLLQTNNVNRETATSGSLLQATNGPQTLLPTFDLGALLSFASTNDPAIVAAVFGVTVAGSSNYFTVVATPNVVAYFTNYVGEPYGTPPHLIVRTNGYTYTPLQKYVTTFANIVIPYPGNYRTNTSATLLTVTVGTQNGAPYGSPLVTNTTTQTITLTNTPSGDYYIIPPGTCGWQILYPLLTNGFATTNLIVAATNSAGFFYSQSIVTYFTNHIFVARACSFVAGATGLYQGIENVKFVRANYDSLIGQYFQPVTNAYTMVFVTNSQPVRQTFLRVVTQPDILLTARDMAGLPYFTDIARNVNFNQANILPGLAGPGTIDPSTVITYNKVGDVFFNGPVMSTNAFLSEATHYSWLAWGSFDGTTNDPVVYPNGMSIQNLQSQILVQISPASLPDGTNGVLYPTTTFTATGGSFSPPFTWSASGLPAGLTLSSGGTLSGTPTQTGTFDFVLQLTDALSRSVQWDYFITIQ